MKILLLEDNDKLNSSILRRLTLKSYKVDTFTDGYQALDNIFNGYDCFILDINVPSINGINILKEIRDNNKTIPILIISSNIDLDTIKNAYDYGCNDYLKKPFFIDELEVKIKKLCQLDTKIITLDDDFTYNMSKRELYNKTLIKLTKKETLLLHQLITHKNKILGYDQILNYVWEGDIATPDSIRTLVMRLRKKIPPNSLETIVDFGYKLNIK